MTAVDPVEARDRVLLRFEQAKRVEQRVEAAGELCALAAALPEADARRLYSGEVARLVSDKQLEVRCAGLALASVSLEPDEAEGLFIRTLSDKLSRVRLEAAGRLADMARPSARGALAGALQDESFPVRFEAARGMAELKHSSGLEVLCEALDDQDLRFRAASALAKLGDPAALPALRKVYERWILNPFDRTQIAGAMVKLGDQSALEHLFKRARKSSSPERAMAVELLGEVQAPGAKELLVGLLENPKDLAWGAAARSLGRLKDPSCLAPLEKALALPDLDDDSKLDLAEGLCRLGLPAAREKASAITLTTDEAREELAAMLEETPA